MTGQPKQIDELCIKAVDDIREKIRENTGILITFSQASMWLGKKYFRDLLGVIPYSEIKSAYHNGKLRKWKE